MSELYAAAARSAGFVVIGLALCYAGKKIRGFLPQWRGTDRGIVSGGSDSLALSSGAYYLAVLMSLGGPVSWASDIPLEGFLEALLFGLLAVVLLNVSVLLAERTYLKAWKLAEGVKAGDPGSALVEGAHYIALGLIIMGASWGDAGGPLAMLCFWLLGQFFLWAALAVYLKLFRIDMPAHLAAKNLPAAFSMAGGVIAFGNVVRSSISGPFLGWGRSTLEGAGYFVFGFALLLCARWLADAWLFPRATFNREIFGSEKPNRPAALLDAFLFIGASALLGWAIG